MLLSEDVLPRRSRRELDSSISTAESAVFLAVFAVGRVFRATALPSLYLYSLSYSNTVILFFLFAFSSVFLLAFQQPWRRKKKLTSRQWLRIVVNSIWWIIVTCFWLAALRRLEVLGTLVVESAEVSVFCCVAALLGWESWQHQKTQSILLISLAVLSVTFSSGSDTQQVVGVASKSPTYGATCLIIACFLSVLRKKFARRLAIEIGGAKGLLSLSSSTSAVLLLPFFLWSRFFGQVNGLDTPVEVTSLHLSDVLILLVLSLTCIVIPYYTEVVAYTRGNATLLLWCALPASFLSAVLLSWLSTFVSPSFLLLGAAGLAEAGIIVCKPSSFRLTGGSLEERPVLPVSLEDEDADVSPFPVNLFFSHVAEVVQHIWKSSHSRGVFIFLLLNFSFMFVEFLYGVWSNSLGLISDAFHMLFDCAALSIGLYAAFMSSWKADKQYTYGYARYEVLAGFVNGILLVCVSIVVMAEAIHRIYAPEIIDSDRLFLIAVVGLLVNLVGVFFFYYERTHHHHGQDHNMRGLFLHVMADTAGSVGVIIASVLVEHLNWIIADSICSVLIGILILVSAIPLVLDTATLLLLGISEEMYEQLSERIPQIEEVEGVVKVLSYIPWAVHGSRISCTVRLEVTEDADEQRVLDVTTSILKKVGVKMPCIQVESPRFQQQRALQRTSYIVL